MKSINAPVAPSETYYLNDRARVRGHSKMDGSSALKRQERRKQRHFLCTNLRSAVVIGLDEGCFPILSPAEAVAHPVDMEEIPAKVRRCISVPAGYGVKNPRMTEVSVIRKVPMRRKTVEMLQVPARVVRF